LGTSAVAGGRHPFAVSGLICRMLRSCCCCCEVWLFVQG
jgi:hypothetical protein